MIKNLHPHRGFTLVESLVAITILMIGVVGPLVIAARGISDGLFAQNQLAANYLAQEGMAVLINLRDQNLARRENDWLQGIDVNVCSGQDCGINVQSGSIDVCSTNTPCKLVYNKGQGLYTHPNDAREQSFGPEFTRTLRLRTVKADTAGPLEVEAIVTLSWLNRLTPKQFMVIEHLYRNRAEGFNP